MATEKSDSHQKFISEYQSWPRGLQVVLAGLMSAGIMVSSLTAVSIYDVIQIYQHNKDFFYRRESDALSPVECADYVRWSANGRGADINDIIYRDANKNGLAETYLRLTDGAGNLQIVQLQKSKGHIAEEPIDGALEDKLLSFGEK